SIAAISHHPASSRNALAIVCPTRKSWVGLKTDAWFCMPPLLFVKRQMQAESGRTSLSSEDGERAPRRPRPRLETLSDLIYGLSLSIGAISLVITNSQSSSASDINRNILQFLFVFLILITSWIIYTSDMSVLPIETRLITFLNIVLLILVALTPYLFDQVVSTFNSLNVQE